LPGPERFLDAKKPASFHLGPGAHRNDLKVPVSGIPKLPREDAQTQVRLDGFPGPGSLVIAYGIGVVS